MIFNSEKTYLLNGETMRRTLIDFSCGAVVGAMLAAILVYHI